MIPSNGSPALKTRSLRAGRPPRAGIRATHRLEMTLTPSEYEAIKRVAHLNQQRMVDFVRDAVVEAACECGDRIVFLDLSKRR